MNKVAALAEIRPTSAIDAPDTKVSAREVFEIDTDMTAPAFSVRTEHVPDIDTAYKFDRETTLAILAGFRLQPPRDDPGLSRHRQVDAYRAGRGSAELALHPRQPRQPYQPHRPHRQGCDRAEGRQADHRVPRGHPALVPAARLCPGVRRIRRRPAGRDVRHPAHTRGRGQADSAGPESRDPAASVVPAVFHRQHGGAGRHHRSVSRHAADQPGSDGPLEHRRHVELPAARDGDQHRAGQAGCRSEGCAR